MDGTDEPESADETVDSVSATTSAPPDAERPEHLAAEKKRKWRLSNPLSKDDVKTLAVALVAAAGAVIGSIISANGAYQAAIGQQQAARQAALNDEARVKRSQVYAALLDAANDFEAKTNNLADEHDRALTSRPQIATDQTITDAWVNSKQKFQSALNQVYIYGSSEEFRLASTLASTLPSAVGSTVRFQHVDDTIFREAYKNFQDQMRCEVPANRPADCK